LCPKFLNVVKFRPPPIQNITTVALKTGTALTSIMPKTSNFHTDQWGHIMNCVNVACHDPNTKILSVSLHSTYSQKVQRKQHVLTMYLPFKILSHNPNITTSCISNLKFTHLPLPHQASYLHQFTPWIRCKKPGFKWPAHLYSSYWPMTIVVIWVSQHCTA